MVVGDKKDQQKVHVANPTVVFEALSKSTARIDPRGKLLAYLGIPELAIYVPVEQQFAQVTVNGRSHLWQGETLSGPEAVLAPPETEAQLPLTSIYERVHCDDVEPDGDAKS